MSRDKQRLVIESKIAEINAAIELYIKPKHNYKHIKRRTATGRNKSVKQNWVKK